MFEIKKASRDQVKLKIGFWGASGSGKTYSALKFAYGLVGNWDEIILLDTENSSASLYSHLGGFDVLDLRNNFSPRRYIEAISFIENQNKYKCIIIDSITHEWNGIGGCLEMQEKLGGRYQDWAKVTPEHNKFVQKILQTNHHVLVTGRSKPDYQMFNENNKVKVAKVGLKTITRDDFEYELTLAFQIQHQSHLASVDKDRTDLFKNETPFLITEETGRMVADWNKSGKVSPRQRKLDLWNRSKAIGLGQTVIEQHYASPLKTMNEDQINQWEIDIKQIENGADLFDIYGNPNEEQ